jgi:hypothetical protein
MLRDLIRNGTDFFFIAIVAETEQLWCRQSTVTKRKNNPTFIYYIASEDAANEQEEILKKETRKLMKKIKAEYALADEPKYNKAIRDLKKKFRQHSSLIRHNRTQQENLQDWNESFEKQFDDLIKTLNITVSSVVEDHDKDDDKDDDRDSDDSDDERSTQ